MESLSLQKFPITAAKEGLFGRAIPLALPYLAFPISNLFVFYTGGELWRNWIDAAWVSLAILSLGLSIARTARISRRLMLQIGAILAIAAWLATTVAAGTTPAVTALMEGKPLFYLFVTLVLVRAFGPPDPVMFCRMGACLSFILTGEMMIRSVVAGALIRPEGSGEVNYDAALLCFSMIFALGRQDFARRYAALIFIGLLATFSRTGLLAISIVVLLSRTVPFSVRVFTVFVAFSGALMSFLIRDLEIGDLESMDRYWMWLVGLQHLATNLHMTAVMTSPGSEIDVDIPPYLDGLWLYQQENLELDGIFPFHFHAMWLRLAVTWGWLPALVLVLATAKGLLSSGRMRRQVRSYAGVCLVLGLTMGLFYLSNVSVPALLAGYILFLSSKSKRQSS